MSEVGPDFSRSFVLTCISPNGDERTFSFKNFGSAMDKMVTLKEMYSADDYEVYEVHRKLVWPRTS